MFYALKVNKAIEKWRKVRINLLIYKRNEAYFPKRIREEHWSELKVIFFWVQELSISYQYSIHLKV